MTTEDPGFIFDQADQYTEDEAQQVQDYAEREREAWDALVEADDLGISDRALEVLCFECGIPLMRLLARDDKDRKTLDLRPYPARF